MSRGVVLRFQPEADERLRAVWTALATARLPSLSRHTHGRHAPHLSLVVAESISNRRAADVMAKLPPPRLITFEAVGYFPQGIVHLVAVPTSALLDLQRQAHAELSKAEAMKQAWPASQPGNWSPHVTMAYGVRPMEMVKAMPLITAALPLTCSVSGLWTEDGDTGEAWPVPHPAKR